ncbi:MAG: DNA mismatch repair protein MutS [Spirochaetes bacterium]|nr:DNA mismatch repair protein MutS [Spirochaetota bacterium]
MTPMVKQYHEIKKNHQDTILFFRLGDFYEMFYDDAVTASKVLEITLTARNTGELKKIPMCGFPYHSAESYIAKLIRNGYKVAICEQVEDPKLAKKLVKREVIEIVTPGTVVNLNMLNQKSNNYLMGIYIEKNMTGLSVIDLSTGEFLVTENRNEDYITYIDNELTRLSPSEIVIPEKTLEEDKKLQKLFTHYPTLLINKYYDWVFEPAYAKNKVLDLYKIKTMEGFGIENKPHIIASAGAVIHYIQETQKQTIRHIDNIKFYSSSDFMELDNATIKNLELVLNQYDNTVSYTLFSILDHAKTPQGARLLKKRILEPLTDITRIKKRLDKIDFFFLNNDIKDDLRGLLNKIHDIERLASRISLFKANPRDLTALKNSLENSLKIKDLLKTTTELNEIIKRIPELNDIIGLISKSIMDEPGIQVGFGQVIKKNYSKELDKVRSAQTEGKEWIAQLQKKEIERTGINSLKIKYNRVFGYYLEVTKANLSQVPDDYMRKQTLVNAERFTFPALQEYEELIVSASEKIAQLEEKIYKEIIIKLQDDLAKIMETGKAIAELDFFSSLAECAYINNYSKPSINNKGIIDIKNGRHPVIEQTVKDEPFIPNDILLDNDENRILIITGPNMAGKSTFLRQIALITLMAQMGSFIPAEKATIGIVDKIFTRIGASDIISKGQSTFLVEMNETANILNNATSKSLIIMDEIGRGTSTYDGLSIAWSIIEYIFDKAVIGAKTLFATHYHELTQLGEKKGIKNYNILIKEWKDDIIFLRKVAPGSADKSYGIQVAHLAGIPREVIDRAKEILFDLESDNIKDIIISQSALRDKDEKQLDLFKVNIINPIEAEIFKTLKGINLDTLTPIEALNILNSIKDKLEKLKETNS